MYVCVLAWKLQKLDRPDLTFAELREWVATKAAADYAQLPGVRLKTWISDERRGIWGAVYLVDSPDDIALDKLPRLPDGRTGPIGTPPHVMDWFQVEATVFGPADPSTLPSLGRAYEDRRGKKPHGTPSPLA
ncbi:hypothetical protein [Nocardia sp. NPDC003979]